MQTARMYAEQGPCMAALPYHRTTGFVFYAQNKVDSPLQAVHHVFMQC